VIEELLKDGFAELGLTFSNEQIDAFSIYLSELKKWNKVYNLTGLKKDKDIIIKHFLDSLLYLNVMPSGKIKVADIGSGAGFPGIPIKIIRPEIEMYLIEPSMKKTAFLIYLIKQLRLKNIEVIEKRIEDIKIAQELSNPVDIAVTRALFTIRGFIKKSSNIVKRGGILILNKGPKVKDELRMLKDVRFNILNVNLPLSNVKRFLVVVNL
jgi:16S rRNA (guanine527-N7)-methyltransferase